MIQSFLKLLGLLVLFVVILGLSHQNGKSQIPTTTPQPAVVVTMPEPPKPEPVRKAIPPKTYKSQHSKYIWHELDNLETVK